MLDSITTVLAHPVGQAILVGAAGAAAADYAAFRNWKRWHDAVLYDWTTATFRWFQGALTGLVTGLGLNAWLG